MKTLTVLAIGATVALGGCASTSGLYQNNQGDKLEVQSVRLFWSTERVKLSMQTNGLPEIEINKTQPDSEAIDTSSKAIGVIVGEAVKAAVTP